MLSYKDFTKYFGTHLTDAAFQSFLSKTFKDLSSYNILEGNYMSSEKAGIDLGFKNSDAVYDDDENVVFEKGNPIFSHLNFYPKSGALVNTLPFDTSFKDTRIVVTTKAGPPTQTNQGHDDLLDMDYLIDNYKVGDIVITFDYDAKSNRINLIQIRDNNLNDELKL